MVGLTERKMDSYLIVNTLQLSMCIMLFAEGRLDPGTPDRLLFAYMLSVSDAFSYFLLSMWFAVHASIAAQAASVEILTQRVRLPIPTWEELERMRTYATSFAPQARAHLIQIHQIHGDWKSLESTITWDMGRVRTFKRLGAGVAIRPPDTQEPTGNIGLGSQGDIREEAQPHSPDTLVLAMQAKKTCSNPIRAPDPLIVARGKYVTKTFVFIYKYIYIETY